MNKGYPLNLRRYRLVRKKDNKYHPAYSHNHVEKEAQLFAGRSKVLSRIAATSIHTENHITNVTNKESKLCNIHGTILLYFTRQNKIFRDYFSSRFAQAELEKVEHFNKAYGKTPLYKAGDFVDFEIFTKYDSPLIISEFCDAAGKFLLVVNNSQSGSERIKGTLEGSPFDEWLAPGQMKVLERVKK